jgi:hypothetical protein
MRSSERRFLKHVGTEFTALRDIQVKLDLTPEEAESFANYLEKQGLVRTTIMEMNLSALGTTPVRLICKPIDKRTWKEKYWWLLSLISFAGGIVAAVIADLFAK